MRKYTNVGDWDKMNKKYISWTSKSFYLTDVGDIISKYTKEGESIFEVGCAPGKILVYLARRLKLKPYGVDYSDEGLKKTVEVFRKAGFEENIFKEDFFSKSFHKENKEKYDIVCSFGFIEHFDNIEEVIGLHANLLKKDGLLIISIPNFARLNKIMTPKSMLDKHNLTIMDLNKLKERFNGLKIVEAKYIGGPFNFGLFQYDNKFIELIRFGLFLFQRILLEPIFYILKFLGIRLENKWASPAMIVIAKKQ